MRAILEGRVRVHPAISSFLVATFLLTLSFRADSAAQEGAQTVTPRPLIVQAVDESQLTTLKGNTHPLARPEFDVGTAPVTLPMERMLLVLKRSPEQEAALRKLLDDEQDKHSPNYHKWLTPEEFGKQFGPIDSDMQTISGWLQSHGFQVGSTKGRTVLEFSGSASQVQEAFHTTIHKYIVRGEQHWANASDPEIPTALTPAVAGVLTLHNFIKKPTLHFSGEKVAAKMASGKPQVTFPGQNGQPAIHALAPQDFATIYNINPLYNYYINPMYSGVNGYGIGIGVVGRSNLFDGGDYGKATDVWDFGNVFHLGFAPYFTVDLNGPDPGDLGGAEEAEATLDSTWSAAIAPGAQVILMVSATTNTTDGTDLSEAFLIEDDRVDIMTESFSACELYATDAQLAGQTALAEQAAAQGIAYIVSTGDNGAEGCDDPNTAPATHPISVNFLASTAYNVAVGGTMFNENGDPSKYWASTPPISETALSYIPEDVWNESSPTSGLWSSGGGASAGNVAAGGTTPGVPKPYWQYGVAGIPNDNVRDLPDVSLTAASHDPYLLCLEGSCEPNGQGEFFLYFVSGTSAAAPSFAGIMALVNQMSERIDPGTGPFIRQGLANYVLYRLAATESSYPSRCNGSNTSIPPASSCVFNDVTVGNNVVPGEIGTKYQAGAGYDLATGLGSVNVTNLANNWNAVTFNPTTTTLTLNGGTTVNITHGQSVPVSITVAPSSGSGTPPSGDASLVLYQEDECCNGFQTWALGLWPLSSGSVSTSTNALPGGFYPLAAQYAGDENYAPSTSATTSITVSGEPSATTVSVLTANASGDFVPFTSGPFGSFVYLRADVAGQSGYGIPTGTVTFNDTFGPLPGGGAYTLNGQGNTATPHGILTFDAGTHTISANYGGDASFNASSSTVSQTFIITPGFFASMASSTPNVIISAPGGSGQTSVVVQYSTRYTDTISLACSGAPSEATCTITPSSVKPTGTAGSTTATVAITTQAATSRLRQGHARTYFVATWMTGAGLLFSIVLVSRRQQQLRIMLLLLLAALVVVIPSCGGAGSSTPPPPPPNPGTPSGTYNLTVTAISGSTVSTTGFALVVQ